MTEKTYVFADRERYRKLVIELESLINTLECDTIEQLSTRNKAMNLLEELRSCVYEAPVDFEDELDELEQFFNKEQNEFDPKKHRGEMLYYSGICCEAEYAKEVINKIRSKRKKG